MPKTADGSVAYYIWEKVKNIPGVGSFVSTPFVYPRYPLSTVPLTF